MLQIIIASLAGIIIFMVLDYIWLAHIAKKFYLDSLGSHVTIHDGSLVPYLPAVPLVYIVSVIAIWVFVLSSVQDVKEAAFYGTLLGLLMYGFYDLTNMATLRGYSWSMVAVDSIWGGVVVGIVTLVMFLVKEMIA